MYIGSVNIYACRFLEENGWPERLDCEVSAEHGAYRKPLPRLHSSAKSRPTSPFESVAAALMV
eukprot:4564475-Pyramimonas_sp.AAC.1